MARVQYRCVCGETIALETATGGQCGNCGRKYAAEALRSAAAETVSIADLSSRNAEPQYVVPLVVEEDPNLGRVLGHFEVLRPLGDGGMGRVYQALDQSLQRYVALKVIRTAPRSVADTPQLQRLFQEAIAQARVNHPHVVHIYYVGRHDGSPFLAMELVGGGTLAQRLEQGPLPFVYVVDLARQIADALRACLQFDIVHGDIKPTNILLTETGAAKLSDFGLATRLSLVENGPAKIAGTPNYIAPERGAGNPPDMRSDMYSLGVTLFEMTFGRLPYTFSGSDIQRRLHTHQVAAIEFPQPWPAEVPEVWRTVLARLLAKDPERRYPSYEALLADLRRVRPVSPPAAGPLPRGLAWFIDLTLVAIPEFCLALPVIAFLPSTRLLGRPLMAVAAGVACSAAPLLFAGVQANWGTSPGKKLFQIRITDRHGLRPSRARLAARSVAQLLPLWGSATILTCSLMGVGILGTVITIAASLAAIADAGYALIQRRRRSLHDLFFDTQVVLDAGLQDRPSG